MSRDGLPRSLPGPAEFDTRATDLEAAYELAWLACDTLAEQVGEQSLLDVYRRVLWQSRERPPCVVTGSPATA